jgi:hypothetical protein
MSSRHRSPQGLHPVLAVVLAGAFHAALLLALARSAPRRVVAVQPPELVGIELSLTEDAVTKPLEPRHPTASRSPAEAQSASEPPGAVRAKGVRTSEPALAAAVRAGVAAAPLAGPGDEQEADTSAAGAVPRASDGAAGQHSIDLGLNGGVRRAAVLGGWLEPEPPPPAPSIGLLVEGLAQLDAQRGVSRSSAAIHAGYEAARRAAPNGIALFDLRTDERGVVLSVTLASAPSEEARWQRVGQELQELLKDRRLRVPAGKKGIATRLRIERGPLAQTLTDRDKTKRGAALGQQELHPREQRDISTRAHLDDPRQISPTLGVSVAAGASALIRVIVLDERAL